jgi:hypothetical protein
MFSVKRIWFSNYEVTVFCSKVIAHICHCPQFLRGCDSMVVGLTSTCSGSAYHHYYGGVESHAHSEGLQYITGNIVFYIHQSVIYIILPIIYCNPTELEWDFTPSQLGLVITLCFTLSRRWHEITLSNNKLLFPFVSFDVTSWFKCLKQYLIVYNYSMHHYTDVIIIISLYLFPVYNVCYCVQPLWCCKD